MRKKVWICILVACFSSCFSGAIAAEWKGKWISFEHTQSEPNTWFIVRKNVQLKNVPKSLTARIAVDSKYWLWINEQLVVFEGGLKRGPARNATYYDEVEIAPYLVAGDNTIAILGWHFGRNGFSHVNSGILGFIFEAIAPGIEILSDGSWMGGVYDAYQNTGDPHPNYRIPEDNIRFDAREEVADWYKKSFTGDISDQLLLNDINDVPVGRLVKRPIPLFKDYGLGEYVSVRKSSKGDTLFCRLPYNSQITPYFKVKARAGCMIQMQTDQSFADDTPNVRAEYITRDGVQEYESFGWMNGHEVWYIVPEGVEVLEVKYRETGYNAEFVNPFRCNDPFYNELWKRGARTLYVTMRDTYMDCPDRERSQWWGDAVNELGETFYALTPSSHQLTLKAIYELMNWQRADGVIFAPVPAGNWNRELPLQMLASVGWYGFYTQYYFSGDSSFIPVIYDGLKKYLHEVWKTDESGLAIVRHGDWGWGDWGDHVDMGVLTTCWYYLALKAEHAFALQLGKTKDAGEIQAMMKKIEDNFDARFWTGTAYRSPKYRGENDDRSQAMAVVSGLASKDKYPALTQALKKEFHASPYMEKYILEALFVMNEDGFALERMKKRYGHMLTFKEITTLFEQFGSVEDPYGGGTVNHAWSGGPLTLLSQKVCGIAPTSPGFRTVRIAPQMGFLKEASATVASVSGDIRVEISVKGRKMTISAVVPEGVTAEIVFPKGKPITVSSGNHTLERNL